MEISFDKETLIRALDQASNLHHDFEEDYLDGERDPQWAGWLAAFLLGRLGTFLHPALLTRWMETVRSGDQWTTRAGNFIFSELERLPEFDLADKEGRKFQIGIEFTRDQLIEPEYNALEEGVVDEAYLRDRYEPHGISIDHAAAVRGILVREPGTKEWKWIWGIGLLHDEMVNATRYPRLYARYRNQYPRSPQIEFEREAYVYAALELLLETTPIKADDYIQVTTPYKRTVSIGDFLGY